MKIEAGQYKYNHFTVYYLNNVLGLICYSLYRGYMPIIEINKGSHDCNNWDWYFKQPNEIFNCETDSSNNSIICDRIWTDFASENIKSLLYKKFVIFNEKTQSYIDNEIKNVGDMTRVLGVLMRGTDYVALKPKGHPIQPQPEVLLKKAKEIFDEKNTRNYMLQPRKNTSLTKQQLFLGVK